MLYLEAVDGEGLKGVDAEHGAVAPGPVANQTVTHTTDERTDANNDRQNDRKDGPLRAVHKLR